MSKIIGFLEQAGRDAALRHATRAELLRRMSEENVDPALQDALLKPQRPALAALLGARETMYCSNQGPQPPKKAPVKAPPKKKGPAKKKAPAKKPAKKAPAKRKR